MHKYGVFVLNLLLILLLLFNCKSKTFRDENMNDQNDRLILKLSVSYSATIGYGNAYKSKVIEVREGDLDQDEIILTVLTEDKESSDFVSEHLSPNEIVAAFTKLKGNVPYSMMPITGFVDKDKTSWKVLSMEPS